MHETLHEHNTTISIGGRPVCILRFEDEIDLMENIDNELQDVTNRLVANAMLHGCDTWTLVARQGSESRGQDYKEKHKLDSKQI